MDQLDVDLTAQPVADIHCFSFAPSPTHTRASLAKLFLAGGPTVKSFSPELRQADMDSSVAYRRMIRELSSLLGVKGTDSEVLKARNTRAGKFKDYVRALFDDARIVEMAVDNGLEPVAFEEFRKYAPGKVERIFRVEPLLKRLLDSSKTFESLLGGFDDAISAAVTKGGYSGFKSVIAYRTGLDVGLVDEAEARRAFEARSRSEEREWFGPRVKPLRDFLLRRVAEKSKKLGAFLEVHTGVGDTDVIAGSCDPLLLKDFLRTPEASGVPIVLIHGGFPYTMESAWLASVFPNVYFELSTPFPPTFLPALSASRYQEVLEVVPTTRIVYGSDAIETPENHWMSAKLAKRAMGSALGELVAQRVVDEDEAYRIAGQVFRGTARALLR